MASAAQTRCNIATEGREQRQVRYQGQRVMEAEWLQLGENREVLARRHFCDDGEVLSIWHIEPASQGRQVQVMSNRREVTLTFLEGFQPN